MPGAQRSSHVASAESAALTASETRRRKPTADNEPERSQAIDHEALHHRTGTRFDAPDRVERRLQLEERAAGREDERDPANHCREQILVPPRRSLQQRLHGLAAFDSDQPLDLADDFTAHGFGTKERAGDGNRNEEDGRDREERVIGDRGAKAEQVVVPPGSERTAEHANRWRECARVSPPPRLAAAVAAFQGTRSRRGHPCVRVHTMFHSYRERG